MNRLDRLADLDRDHRAPRGALTAELDRPRITEADQRALAAALAYAADHHPNADPDRLGELAHKISPAAGAYFDAVRAGRCTCTTHRPTGAPLPAGTPGSWPA